MKTRVVVTGMGAITPIGNDVGELLAGTRIRQLRSPHYLF